MAIGRFFSSACLAMGFGWLAFFPATASAQDAQSQTEAVEAVQEEVDLFAKFGLHDENSTQSMDYRPVDEFLKIFSVEGRRGRTGLYYDAIQGEALTFLKQLIVLMSRVEVTELKKDQQLAFWLNFHNVLVIHEIVEKVDGRDIEDERGTFAEPGDLWKTKLIAVQGVPISIHDIEKEILFRFWARPEVIYGLYQGVRGGPRLPRMAFRGDNVWADLDMAAKTFVNGRKTVDVGRNELELSSYFDWYKQAAFAGSDAHLIAHIRSKADDDLAEDMDKRLGDAPALKFDELSYRVEKERVRRRAPQSGYGGNNSFSSSSTGGSYGS